MRMTPGLWIGTVAVAILLLVVGFRVTIRSLRRFVRAFWPH
ncbi:MAG: hypothetical protein ABI634_13410 [Acidobacteriota bacterium]